MRALSVAVVLLGLLAGCSDGGDHGTATGPDPAGTSPSPTYSASPSPTPTRATPAPEPAVGACYDLTYDQSLAPASSADDVKCRREHTAQTFRVADLDPVVGGHLLAVDSDRVQSQVASRCPAALGDYVGGTEDQQRLSVLRAVWFTPTVVQADAGATWYRCDVIAVAAQEQLAGLPKDVRGVLDSSAGRDEFGVCGTDQPGVKDFQRVVCSRTHAWKAISVVDLPAGTYPGRAAAEAAGQAPCQAAGAAAAADALDYQWSYEWPTRKQWRAGQTYGLCWIPD